MSNDCCFRRDAQGQLLQCNRRNTVTVLKTLVKSPKGLNGTKVFLPVGVFEEILKISQNLKGRARAGVLSL